MNRYLKTALITIPFICGVINNIVHKEYSLKTFSRGVVASTTIPILPILGTYAGFSSLLGESKENMNVVDKFIEGFKVGAFLPYSIISGIGEVKIKI